MVANLLVFSVGGVIGQRRVAGGIWPAASKPQPGLAVISCIRYPKSGKKTYRVKAKCG